MLTQRKWTANEASKNLIVLSQAPAYRRSSNLLADRRLANSEITGCRGRAATLHNSDKNLQTAGRMLIRNESRLNRIKSIARTPRYEPGTIVAEGDFVIVHRRFGVSV